MTCRNVGKKSSATVNYEALYHCHFFLLPLVFFWWPSKLTKDIMIYINQSKTSGRLVNLLSVVRAQILCSKFRYHSIEFIYCIVENFPVWMTWWKWFASIVACHDTNKCQEFEFWRSQGKYSSLTSRQNNWNKTVLYIVYLSLFVRIVLHSRRITVLRHKELPNWVVAIMWDIKFLYCRK